MSKTTNTFCRTADDAHAYIRRMIKNAEKVGIKVELLEAHIPFDSVHTTVIKQDMTIDDLLNAERRVRTSVLDRLEEMEDDDF